MDHLARAEAVLLRQDGDVIARLSCFVTEALARATVTEANEDNDAALLWKDAAEGVLPLLDFLAGRAALDVSDAQR